MSRLIIIGLFVVGCGGSAAAPTPEPTVPANLSDQQIDRCLDRAFERQDERGTDPDVGMVLEFLDAADYDSPRALIRAINRDEKARVACWWLTDEMAS